MRITKADIVNVLDNLNREAEYHGEGTTYLLIKVGNNKTSIRIRRGNIETSAVDTFALLTDRETYWALAALLRGRQHDREDRRRAVFGTTTVA